MVRPMREGAQFVVAALALQHEGGIRIRAPEDEHADVRV